MGALPPQQMRTTEESHTLRALALMLGAAAIAMACSSNSMPKGGLPPQTLAPMPPELKQPVSNAPQELEPDQHPSDGSSPQAQPTEDTWDAIEAKVDPTVLVVERATTPKPQGSSLYAAAQAEKERRQRSAESTIVLDDKTLKDHSKGSLTYLEEEAGDAESVEAEAAPESDISAAEGEEGSSNPPAAGDPDDDEVWSQEQYWRNRVLEPRMEWRRSLDSIDELEGEIARLRHDFYAEDDPFYRDSQIKPAWDLALDDLKEAKRDADRYQVDLEKTILEGRRKGALPGWLREGIELEPTEEELAETFREEGRFHEPSEPVIAGDDDNGND